MIREEDKTEWFKKWHSFTDLLPADLRRYLDSVDYQNSARYGGVQWLTQFLTADAP